MVSKVQGPLDGSKLRTLSKKECAEDPDQHDNNQVDKNSLCDGCDAAEH